MKKRTVLALACSTTLAALLVSAPAHAGEERRGDGRGGGGHDHGTPESPELSLEFVETLADGLLSPLSLEVDRDGGALLSQNFLGQVTGVSSEGTVSTVATASVPGRELGAASSRRGTLYFAENDQPAGVALLMSQDLEGAAGPELLADLGEYEAEFNPDQVNEYGFTDLDAGCAALIDPAGPGGPASYSGAVDPHPYASLAVRDGVYVADAGGNDILLIDDDGAISTVAVLPPGEPVTATADLAAAAGYPDCVVGHDYRFEPVPTDVERGPDGLLYVSTLPGGPEDASLGLRGAVYTVDPDDGTVEFVAGGFAGAMGLAVDRESGVVLVAELFGGAEGTGQISAVSTWSGETLAAFPVSSPAAIELRRGSVYATTDAFVPDTAGAPQAIGQLTVWSLTDAGDGHGWGDDGHGGDDDQGWNGGGHGDR